MHILLLIFTVIAAGLAFNMFAAEQATFYTELGGLLYSIIASIFAIGHGITWKLHQLIKGRKNGK